jgi:hypothetical protein
MGPSLSVNPPPSPAPPPAAANEDSALSTPSAGNKSRIGGAPNRQSYSRFTKVSLVKRFLATHQKSYSKYLERLTPQEWQEIGIQDPSQIPPSKTFRKWLVDKEILQAVESNLVLQPNRKRQRKCEYPQVEGQVRKYMEETGERSIPRLRRKAMEIAEQALPPDHSFTASNGWMQKVLERGRACNLIMGLPVTAIDESIPATNDDEDEESPPTDLHAIGCVIRLSNYADHIGNKDLKNAVAQVSLAMTKIQHAKQLQQQNNANFSSSTGETYSL